MTVSWEVRQGDALERLREMPDESVHCCVTSPPYYGLRDYDVPPAIWGADLDCAHEWGPMQRGKRQDIKPADETTSTARLGTDERQGGAGISGGRFCERCGAWEGCLGLEPSLDLYVEHLVELFAEVRRVLRSDGTLWLNLGDSYASKPRGSDEGWDKSRLSNPGRLQKAQAASLRRSRTATAEGVKEKDLMMVPATVAIALRADGWWLRKEIIWAKRSPMPENVSDRPTSSHEKLYLLAKSARYFYDSEAVREEDGGRRSVNGFRRDERISVGEGSDEEWLPGGGRHLRDVWMLSSAPFPAAHFATFPPKLVEPCILAGTSDEGTCLECGAPYQRIVEIAGQTSRDRVRDRGLNPTPRQPTGTSEQSLNHLGKHRENERPRRTIGWEPTCDHTQPGGASLVLDPFAGAATTGLVALRHGRSFLGLELNADYCELGRRRLRDDQPLLNAASEAAA